MIITSKHLALFLLVLPMFFIQEHRQKALAQEDMGHGYRHTGKLPVVISGVPDFRDYPVYDKNDFKVAEDIDFSSHPAARPYRTRLREGLKSGPNYAHKYRVVTFGCGSSCQANLVLNLENGKVLGSVSTTYGVKYTMDSTLLIADEWDFDIDEVLSSNDRGPSVWPINYFSVEGNEFKEIYDIEVQFNKGPVTDVDKVTK